jgi:hypothetical protein
VTSASPLQNGCTGALEGVRALKINEKTYATKGLHTFSHLVSMG